jgi:hypothetical protein
VEIFGVIRNTSTVKTKLNGGVLKEDLKIELPRQFRKLKSITQVDGDLGFRKSGTPKKNPVVRDGGFSLRERESSTCGSCFSTLVSLNKVGWWCL